MNNLPKVVTQQRRGRASNPLLLDRKSDALPLNHRANPSPRWRGGLVVGRRCNCSCVLNRLGNKSGSKFYKISQVLNKVMLKFSGFVFHEHNLYVFCLFFYSAHRRINIVVDVVVARHSRHGILNPWIGSLA